MWQNLSNYKEVAFFFFRLVNKIVVWPNTAGILYLTLPMQVYCVFAVLVCDYMYSNTFQIISTLDFVNMYYILGLKTTYPYTLHWFNYLFIQYSIILWKSLSFLMMVLLWQHKIGKWMVFIISDNFTHYNTGLCITEPSKE